MAKAYLPGTVRERIQDLMKEHHLSQSELAAMVGSSDSALSRFLRGKTDKLGDEAVIRLARAFNVSTDFLLGETDIPDRKNYEIAELGLSVEAAKNLYTGKVCSEIVSRLLESPTFAEVTYRIEQHCNDELAKGIAAQNQLYSTLSDLTRTNVKSRYAGRAARDIGRLKTPVYQADLTMIEVQFMNVIREIKRDKSSEFTAVKEQTDDITRKVFEGLTKDQDRRLPKITPEQVADTMMDSVAGLDLQKETLDTFRNAMILLFSDLERAAKQGKADESRDNAEQ